MKVKELFTPLSDDSEGIFQKGNHDEETANCWKVSAEPGDQQIYSAKTQKCPLHRN